MAKFQERFLPATWKKDLANEIWQESMQEGSNFIDWIENLRGCNGLLVSYPEFIDDSALLVNLHGRISKPLQDAIWNIKEIHECNNSDVWTKLVTVQDNELWHKHKEIADVVATLESVKCQHLKNSNATATLSSSASTVPTAFCHLPHRTYTLLLL